MIVKLALFKGDKKNNLLHIIFLLLIEVENVLIARLWRCMTVILFAY